MTSNPIPINPMMSNMPSGYTTSITSPNTPAACSFPMIGTMPYATLGTYGNVNSYWTGATSSIFDYALKSQDTNQAMTSQSMTNNYNNAYQGNVLSATAMAQTTEVQKLATDICNIIRNNQLSQFKDKWEDFKVAVAQNSIYSQAIDTSNGNQVTAMAESVFQQLTSYSIQEILKNTSDNSFMNGVKSGASLGFWGSGTSQDDALAYISETDVKNSSKIAEAFGGTVGGAVTGAAGSMVITALVDGVSAVFGNSKDLPISAGSLGKISTASGITGALFGLISSIYRMNQDDN